jgi:hypothetical protein
MDQVALGWRVLLDQVGFSIHPNLDARDPPTVGSVTFYVDSPIYRNLQAVGGNVDPDLRGIGGKLTATGSQQENGNKTQVSR